MNWLTGKLALYVSGGLLILLLGVSTFAGYQHLVIGRLQADAKTHTLELDVAQSANKASTATILGLVNERDNLLLARALEQDAAEKAVAESREVAQKAMQYAMAAKERIRVLSRRSDCLTAMAAPVCPSIADELRKAP